MLEKIKLIIEEHDYHGHLEDEELYILAKNGYLNSENEPSRGYVASVIVKDGKLWVTEVIVPYSKTWEVQGPDDIIKYLLERFPNLGIGEEMSW